LSGHGRVDGGLDRPAPLARVRHPPSEFRESRIRDQGGRREIQQPRRDHTAAHPHLRDVREIELVLVVFGVAQGRRLSVDLVFLLAHVGGPQHAQSSAYAAMRPYSIPLCTILTKWPAPFGPQWRYPCSAVPP